MLRPSDGSVFVDVADHLNQKLSSNCKQSVEPLQQKRVQRHLGSFEDHPGSLESNQRHVFAEHSGCFVQFEDSEKIYIAVLLLI